MTRSRRIVMCTVMLKMDCAICHERFCASKDIRSKHSSTNVLTFTQVGLQMTGYVRCNERRHDILYTGISDITKRWHKSTDGANITHRSRSRVGDPAIVHLPVVVSSFPVCKRPVKRCTDVFHVIHAHCISFKDGTEWKKQMKMSIQAAVRQNKLRI